MIFSTKVPVKKSAFEVDYSSKIVLLGSCFSENIETKLDYFKFQNCGNPFGIIFNPISIENLIRRAVLGIEFTENDIFFHNGLWKCFEVHSQLNGENKQGLLNHLNLALNDCRNQLLSASHLIITYGTSWVYKNTASNQVVANCHKVPQNQFSKYILSIDSIEKSIQSTIDLVSKFNSKCHVIFTISPVRHLKDGLVENTQSKAHLFSALHKVLNLNQHCSNYFPSYEILLDELRDYRFYADDLLHPSKMAIDCIWERFCETYCNDKTRLISAEIDGLNKAIAHRPMNQNSENFEKFTVNLQLKIAEFSKSHPTIKF